MEEFLIKSTLALCVSQVSKEPYISSSNGNMYVLSKRGKVEIRSFKTLLLGVTSVLLWLQFEHVHVLHSEMVTVAYVAFEPTKSNEATCLCIQ